MLRADFTTVGIFLLLLSHSASPLVDDVGGDAELLPADESGFALVEVRGTTIVEKPFTKGEIWSAPTLRPGLELSSLRTVDATITAIYTTIETTTLMVPTGTPPLQEDYSWLLTTSVYTQMAGPQEAIIYKRPILTLGTRVPPVREPNAARPTPEQTPSVTQIPHLAEDVLLLPTTNTAERVTVTVTQTSATTVNYTKTVATPSPVISVITEYSTRFVTITERINSTVTVDPLTEYVTRTSTPDPVTLWSTRTFTTTLPALSVSPQTSWLTSTVVDERTTTIFVPTPTTVIFAGSPIASGFIAEKELTTKTTTPAPVTTPSILMRYLEALHVRHLPKYLYAILSAALGKLSLKQTVDGRQRIGANTMTSTVFSFPTPTLGTVPAEFIEHNRQYSVASEPLGGQGDCVVKVLVPWTAVNVPADFSRPRDLELWYPYRINLSIIDAGYRSEQYTLVANGVPIGSTSDFDHDTSNEVHCGRTPKDVPKCFVRGFSRGHFILPAHSRGIRLFTSYTSRFTGHSDQSSTVLYQVTSVCDDEF